MNNKRPDPDELLKIIQAEGKANKRGRLKIFFGACAGVGKTYAMLNAAHEKIDDGITVLAGVIETHGRPETEELLKNITLLPRQEIEHRGIKFKEFDLENALKANPDLILMDELAHTNVPGATHPKRWMDVQDLLNAGINVYGTLNVQHIESLNDLIAETTGVHMKETVPDAFFDEATDIVLIDIPSDELLERLREGKVYTSGLGKKQAAENFFQRKHLIALRQLALRRTTERVDASYDKITGRIGVCLGSDQLTPRLLRSTKRTADALSARWVALYVEKTSHYELGREQQVTLEHNMHLVEQLGGKTEILYGDNPALTIMEYARNHGINKIIVGKIEKPAWREWLFGSLADRLIRFSGDNIDIHVITRGEETLSAPPSPTTQKKKSRREPWTGYLFAIAAAGIATALSFLFKSYLNQENFIMLYFLGVVLTAARYGWKPSIIASCVSFLAYNFLFSYPDYEFFISDYHDILILSILLITGILAGIQTSRLHTQTLFFRRKERNTAALYTLSHQLAATRGRENMVAVICLNLEEVFDAKITVWLSDETGALILASHPGLKQDPREEHVAWWAYERQQSAGLGTSTLPAAKGYYIPLIGSTGKVGVLGITPKEANYDFSDEERSLLEIFASLAATALERVELSHSKF